MKWEYKILSVYNFDKDDFVEALLNTLGVTGWEIVAAVGDATRCRIFLKRNKV